MKILEAFSLICELALLLGQRPPHPAGCRKVVVDERWTVYLNPHREPCKDPEWKIEVAPFSASIYWNGWLAGLLDPKGGAIAAHPTGASEDRLIRDLRAAIAAAKGGKS